MRTCRADALNVAWAGLSAISLTIDAVNLACIARVFSGAVEVIRDLAAISLDCFAGDTSAQLSSFRHLKVIGEALPDANPI